MGTGSVLIEVGIGLAYLYLLLALLCTAINEAIAQILSLRAANLVRGLRLMLDDERVTTFSGAFLTGRAKTLLEHGLIGGSSARRWMGFGFKKADAPAYISPRAFALALLDQVCGGDSANAGNLSAIRSAVANLPDGSLRSAMAALVNEAGQDLEKLRQGIERWFNDSMDRVGGWYKRRSQYFGFGIAVVLVVSLNADTIEFAKTMHRDAPLRAALVAAAERAPALGAGEQPGVEPILAQLRALPMPLGWKDSSVFDGLINSSWTQRFGLFLSALAVSLGAPFWFDILNKVMSLRAAGKRPEADGKS